MENENYDGNYQIWKGYLIHANTLAKINRKMSFIIKSFCLDKIPDNLLGRVQKSDILKELESERKTFKLSKNVKLNEIMTYEEFSSVLEKVFRKAESEDKSKQFTFNTAAVYRLVADLCDVLIIWEKLEDDEEIKKLSKKIIKKSYF